MKWTPSQLVLLHITMYLLVGDALSVGFTVISLDPLWVIGHKKTCVGCEGFGLSCISLMEVASV